MNPLCPPSGGHLPQGGEKFYKKSTGFFPPLGGIKRGFSI